MNSEKYIGLDVHQATISIAVMDSTGKVVMESILETKGATILEFFEGLRGTLSVTFEEGTWAAWLYDLLKPHVAKLVVCNPRKNALLKDGNKSDRIDARKLAELLYLNKLSPVYHGETGMRMLRELARSYLTIVKDTARVMSRLKAVYRSWAIPCAGRDVYYRRHRDEWLGKITEAGVRRRTEQLYLQLDMLQHLRQQARRELLAESRRHPITGFCAKPTKTVEPRLYSDFECNGFDSYAARGGSRWSSFLCEHSCVCPFNSFSRIRNASPEVRLAIQCLHSGL